MLSTGDLKGLQRASSRAAKFVRIVLVVMSCFMLLAGVANLVLVSRLAESLNTSFWALLVRSVERVDATGVYPGPWVLARDLVATAVRHFVLGAAMMILTCAVFTMHRRDRRILAELQRVGAVSSPAGRMDDKRTVQ